MEAREGQDAAMRRAAWFTTAGPEGRAQITQDALAALADLKGFHVWWWFIVGVLLLPRAKHIFF
jgi:hypothetical protein